MPLRSAGLPRIGVRQTVRGKHVVGAHGPKAKREYQAFNGKKPLPRSGAPSDGQGPSREQLSLPLTVSPLQIVQRFHELARGASGYQPAPRGRELSRAEKLLGTYGFERVNFMIDFAIRQAERTKFQMQTFGAVQQYVTDAIKAYERIKQDEEEEARLRAKRDEVSRQQTEVEHKAEEALRLLTAKERSSLYEEVKKDLAMKCPRVCDWKPEVLESTIRAAMLTRIRRKVWEKGHSSCIAVDYRRHNEP